MDFLKKIFLSFLFLNLVSCAKFSYVIEQGIGQFKLGWNSVKNQEILADEKISHEIKDKIRKIEKYKKFFYEYMGKEQTDIYSKTTILKTDAVTHLVISSPHDEIKALGECFPFVGCFPYLGFFKEDSAKEYVSKMEKKGYITWKRPVYAYSTLGNFTDPILSSFFHFDEFQLAEIIFHELFHTIFFVKNEVDLNESLANYFGKNMAILYFKYDERKKRKLFKDNEKQKMVDYQLVKMTNELQSIYSSRKKKSQLSHEDTRKILNDFLQSRFIPHFKKLCKSLEIKESSCYPLHRKWNNASFAAYLTYEKNEELVEKLHKSLKTELNAFFYYLIEKLKDYNNSEKEKSFEEYLLN